MKNKWQFLVCILAIVCGCSASKNIVSVENADESVTVDGNLTEWKSSNRNYSVETKLRYGFSADRDNFYVYFVAHDEPTQMKILTGGLTLKIDTLGGRKDHVTITYPFSEAGKKPVYPGESVRGEKRNLKPEETTIKLAGFKHPVVSGQIPVQNALGFKAAIAWSADGSMIYELCLPLRSFYTIKREDRILGITAIVNAGSVPGGGAGRMRPGGNPPDRPGGMPEHGPGGRMDSKTVSDFGKASSFRIIIELANKL
jgi:hypothetical protein